MRLSTELIARLDAVAQRTGLPGRTAVMKFCIKTFLDHFEAEGKSSLPADWEKILADLDGRTHRYDDHPISAESKTEYRVSKRSRGPKGKTP